jgi:formylglycine-generating enzyme required for sulfatase activity
MDEYVVDLSERRDFKERLESRQGDWVGLSWLLTERFKVSGEDWKTPDTWKSIWSEAEPLALKLGLSQVRATKVADFLWRSEVEAGRPAPQSFPEENGADARATVADVPPAQGERERTAVRLAGWVSSLPDGAWDVVGWTDFLLADDLIENAEQLQRDRDLEIERQFPLFETVSINPDGTLCEFRRSRARQLIEKIDEHVSLSLVRVPAGRFMMGSKLYSHEGPVHAVEVSEFYLSRQLITQAQWRAVTRLPAVNMALVDNPSYFQGTELPVDSVSWPEATEFCRRLNALTGKPYRLPSEAEWEYACRAQSDTPFAFGNTITAQVVNYDGTHPYEASPVGQFRGRTVGAGSLGAANGFGLHDMHGNLWEWCADEWHEDYCGKAPTDAGAWIAQAKPTHRTLRGGAWCNWAEVCRSSERIKGCAVETEKLYYIGFRVGLMV